MKMASVQYQGKRMTPPNKIILLIVHLLLTTTHVTHCMNKKQEKRIDVCNHTKHTISIESFLKRSNDFSTKLPTNKNVIIALDNEQMKSVHLNISTNQNINKTVKVPTAYNTELIAINNDITEKNGIRMVIISKVDDSYFTFTYYSIPLNE